MKQLSLFPLPDENEKELFEQVKAFEEYRKKKRNWENAFQKWSNEHSQDGNDSYGCCGYGAICDYCDDNSYGRPCVRALNARCLAKGLTVNYSDRDFWKIWNGRLP